MIPILEEHGAVAEFAGRIDGLLLSGGDDIHPRYYGEELSEKTGLSPDIRTDYEFALLKEMLALDKPVLGICLGVQAMNVYFGGKLHQDIGGHKEKGADSYHEVKVEGGMLADIVGAGMMRVNSFHHQAIKTVGDGLLRIRRIAGRYRRGGRGSRQEVRHRRAVAPGTYVGRRKSNKTFPSLYSSL